MRLHFSCLHFHSSSETPISEEITSEADVQSMYNFRVFSYNELKAATRDFHHSNKIGQGAFGSVYKGCLEDGNIVAVKVLSIEQESLRGEREFISEIAALCNIKHRNLVMLQGCCIHRAQRFLVYEYMHNNSLAHALLGRAASRRKFDWEARRSIALDVARGLAFLHEEVEPNIVHRDIKANNILLDQSFTAKVSDFGLSKLLINNKSHVSTRVAGTLGYLAPEYAITGHLTRKSDVYSFGVLVFEIITGRPSVDFDLEHGEHYLVQKVWEAYNNGKLLQVMDPVIIVDKNASNPEEEVIRFLKVGLLCVQETARLRPRMSEALGMLSTEIDITDLEVCQPGLIDDLMGIKMGKAQSPQSILSKVLNSIGTNSPMRSKYFDSHERKS